MDREQTNAHWERALVWGVRTVLRRRPAPPPDWSARKHRVLFLRHDKIGDMVMSTGVISAIAHSHPTIQLDVLASRSNASVLHDIPGIREVLVLDGVSEGARPWAAARVSGALRARHYDTVVDGLVLARDVSPTTAMLLATCGAPTRIGMRACMGEPRGGARDYTVRVDPPVNPDASHVEYLACLAGPFGVDPADVPRPFLRLSRAEQDDAETEWEAAAEHQHSGERTAHGPRLLVNVSAGHWRRRWSDAQFVAAIRYVQQAHAGATIVLVGEPAERAAVNAIALDAGVTAPATPNVRAAFALVACADGVLTPDTSVAHAASAFRKPCVTLMLPGAEPFTPYRTPGVVVMSPTMEMTAVSITDVTSALNDLLELMAGRVPVSLAARESSAAAPRNAFAR